MLKNILTAFVVALIFFSSGLYLYKRGRVDGEQNYKQSHRMYLALKSAYHFGYVDAKLGNPEDWDNGGESHTDDK